MKFLLPTSFLASLLVFVSFIPAKQIPAASTTISPLADYSAEWNDPKYLKCNTAANVSYLSAEEKKTIYVLNMIRMNPVLFGKTVMQQYPDKGGHGVFRNSSFYKSLIQTLQKTQPMELLYADSLCFKSALCHAQTTGKDGTVTHDRTTEECKKQLYFRAECCHYGYNTALDILVSLLVDEGVPSLGHRESLLGAYQKLGVSIQPHKKYGNTAVLDFH